MRTLYLPIVASTMIASLSAYADDTAATSATTTTVPAKPASTATQGMLPPAASTPTAAAPVKEKVQSNIQLPAGTPINAPAATQPASQSTTLSAKPASTTPATAAPSAATPASAEEAVMKPVKAVLQDGTHIELDSDGYIYVVENGQRTMAPDGMHTLKDGTTFEVKDGKRVTDDK